MDRTVDITPIIVKLLKAGIVEMLPNGYKGVFSLKDHSHLLEPQELDLWLLVLHAGSSHDDKKCTDLHSWAFYSGISEENKEH